MSSCLKKSAPLVASCTFAICLLAFATSAFCDGPLIAGIERQTLWRNREGGSVTWFHPRVCIAPSGQGPYAVMTLQSISGSDYFGPVEWSESHDGGKTWGEPRPIPGMGRKPAADGAEEGVCDTVPEFHAGSGTILAIGHSVFYNRGHLMASQEARHPVYIVGGCNKDWSKPQVLEWKDPRGAYIYTCGCAQRLELEGGDVLIPISFSPSPKTPHSVTTFRCTFDGESLKIKEVGTELKGSKGRGFLEPSITRLGKTFYMTIRAEDNHGYVSRSSDGVHWDTPIPWAWDDESPLDMSTTQQRWLPHSDGLLLVYTRKDPQNTGVMRWRAPLFVAEVDMATMKLRRASEQVVFPLVGDGVKDGKHVPHYGNFHTTVAATGESWVTCGEVITANFHGDTLLARVKWTRPNKLAE